MAKRENPNPAPRTLSSQCRNGTERSAEKRSAYHWQGAITATRAGRSATANQAIHFRLYAEAEADRAPRQDGKAEKDGQPTRRDLASKAVERLGHEFGLSASTVSRLIKFGEVLIQAEVTEDEAARAATMAASRQFAPLVEYDRVTVVWKIEPQHAHKIGMWFRSQAPNEKSAKELREQLKPSGASKPRGTDNGNGQPDTPAGLNPENAAGRIGQVIQATSDIEAIGLELGETKELGSAVIELAEGIANSESGFAAAAAMVESLAEVCVAQIEVGENAEEVAATWREFVQVVSEANQRIKATAAEYASESAEEEPEPAAA
jgi:hypothetical protein